MGFETPLGAFGACLDRLFESLKSAPQSGLTRGSGRRQESRGGEGSGSSIWDAETALQASVPVAPDRSVTPERPSLDPHLPFTTRSGQATPPRSDSRWRLRQERYSPSAIESSACSATGGWVLSIARTTSASGRRSPCRRVLHHRQIRRLGVALGRLVRSALSRVRALRPPQMAGDADQLEQGLGGTNPRPDRRP
jgi:hypothetical protein